jgi:hypothetical protein
LEGGGVEDAGLVEALGDAGYVRHGFVAGAGALALALDTVEDRLNGIQAETLPAVLHLDVGQSEAVLQRSSHLQGTMLANEGEGLNMGRWTFET